MSHAVLRAEGLAVSHGQIRLFEGIDLSVDTGDAVVVQGRSGVGKSTLLRALVGLEPLDAGTVWLNGRRWDEWEPKKFRRRASLVMQHSPMFDGTVLANVAFGPKLARSAFDRSQAERLLQRVALPVGIVDRDARHLSGGEQQRVAIARALANEPDILLLDEPTSDLDRQTSEQLVATLRKLTEEGMALLAVTHDPWLAEQLGARRYELTDGGLRRQKT